MVAFYPINTFAYDGFGCIGNYSEVVKGEDYSGLEIRIHSPTSVTVTVYEGSRSSAKAEHIKINDQKISFDYFDNHFMGECRQNSILYKIIGRENKSNYGGGVLRKVE
jgi:hypothetical protein